MAVAAKERPEPMSCAAYAKRRGVTAMAVSAAIRKGRLKESVRRNRAGVPKITDPELADREWDANTDLTRAPTYVKERAGKRDAAPAPQNRGGRPPAKDDGDKTPSLSDAAAAEKHWRAKLAELQYREKAGELVEVKEVAAKLVDVFTQCKTKLLGIPSRARQQLPHLTAADVGTLEELVREALEELAGEEDA